MYVFSRGWLPRIKISHPRMATKAILPFLLGLPLSYLILIYPSVVTNPVSQRSPLRLNTGQFVVVKEEGEEVGEEKEEEEIREDAEARRHGGCQLY
jgi:hypothetical protein